MFFGGDPFEHAHHGRAGGGRGRGPVDNESYYQALGLAKTASDKEIKSAFRKLALQHHPDRGGDPETVSYFYNFKFFLIDLIRCKSTAIVVQRN